MLTMVMNNNGDGIDEDDSDDDDDDGDDNSDDDDDNGNDKDGSDCRWYDSDNKPSWLLSLSLLIVLLLTVSQLLTRSLSSLL